MIHFTIPVFPRTKKNHQQLIWRNGKAVIIPSRNYQEYEKECRPFIPHPSFAPVTGQINVKAIFYMGTKRKVDLVNLEQALLDILVKYGLIEDDNSKIVVSMDGSRVAYDHDYPRTEVTITEIEKGETI